MHWRMAMSEPAAAPIGVIGGTGLDHPGMLEDRVECPVTTQWGAPSASPMRGVLAGIPVVFIARHGRHHEWPPHRVNYRANVAALQQLGVRKVIALNAVGGIAPWLGPGRLALPDQLIDYTWGRVQSFWDAPGEMRHIDFTAPLDETLRAGLLAAAEPGTAPRGTYGVTQGPRLETSAEIERLARDGCDMVGMTLMPEAALARELDLAYACIALSVNWAAGRGRQPLHAEMAEHLQAATQAAVSLLRRALPGLAAAV